MDGLVHTEREDSSNEWKRSSRSDQLASTGADMKGSTTASKMRSFTNKHEPWLPLKQQQLTRCYLYKY